MVKAKLPFLVRVLSFVLGAAVVGCAYLKPLDAEKMTREQFAADARSPLGEVAVFWIPESDGRYVASGCGQQNSYTIRCGDRYFTGGPACGARLSSGQ